MATDTPLQGGRTNPEVVRRGDRVHRSSHINSEFVRLLLAHFERIGFDAVPRAFGSDEVGRDVFEFMDGEVPAELTWHNDETLVAAARLIRAFHDASQGMVSAQARAAGFEVVCHNDLSPCNFVFRDETPVAIIDFDAACLGNRLYDVGYAAWLWLQIGDEDIAPAEQARRLALFSTAYGGLTTSAVVASMLVRQALLMQQGQHTGNKGLEDWANAAWNWTREELSAL